MNVPHYKLSVIVPCYNEYMRFPLLEYECFIAAKKDINFFFVNDGSNDETQSLLYDLQLKFSENVKVLSLEKNYGKAEAVRQGVMFALVHSNAQYLSYLDADLSTPLSELQRLYLMISEKDNLMLVFGSRVSVFGSRIKRLSYRHYGGRIIATMIDMVLNLSIYDTQCGLKVIKRPLAEQLFRDAFITRWLFDVEIFAKMKLLFPKNNLMELMQEIPINEWTEKGDSKVKVVDVLKVPFALMRIRRNYLTQDDYQIITPIRKKGFEISKSIQ
jgi:dolichyl-phosphate beta-glucosyltransferase